MYREANHFHHSYLINCVCTLYTYTIYMYINTITSSLKYVNQNVAAYSFNCTLYQRLIASSVYKVIHFVYKLINLDQVCFLIYLKVSLVINWMTLFEMTVASCFNIEWLIFLRVSFFVSKYDSIQLDYKHEITFWLSLIILSEWMRGGLEDKDEEDEAKVRKKALIYSLNKQNEQQTWIMKVAIQLVT